MGRMAIVRIKPPPINVRKQSPVASLRHSIPRSSFFNMILRPFAWSLAGD
jgi:hypothetical protein